MRNKFFNTIVVSTLCVGSLLFVAAGSLFYGGCLQADTREDSAVNPSPLQSAVGGRESLDSPVDMAEAKRRIASQTGLADIPQGVWKQLLSAEQYKIMWKKGTERAFTGSLLNNKQAGVYVTAGCKIPVFRSTHKFESGTGWPSFWEVYDKANVILNDDSSWGMTRTEVLSACGEHLGHVFMDGPEPTGLRYCINSAALEFIPLSAEP